MSGKTLTFEPFEENTMRDKETGSIWSALSGEALTGEMAGAQLVQLPSFLAFWFSWSDFYPGTDVYEARNG